MKKFFSFLCAMMLVMSASAARLNGEVKSTAVKHYRQLHVEAPAFSKHHAVKAEKVAAVRPAHAPKRVVAATADFAGTIAISNLAAKSATVTINPTSTEDYYWDLLSADEFDAIENGQDADFASIEDYIFGLLDYYINTYYAGYGLSVADFVSNGVDTYDFSGLTANTEYVVFAAEVDADGNVIGAVVTERFTTLAPTPVTAFDGAITVSGISATGASIDVVPTSDGTYFWDVIDKATYDAIVAGTDADYASMDDYVADFLDYILYYYSLFGYDATYEDILYMGADSYDYDNLDPNTEYVVYAVSVDEDGQVVGGYVTVNFTTQDIVPSTNVITLAGAADGTITVTTTTNDPYFLWVETKEDYDGYQSDYTNASLLSEIEDWIYTLEQNGISASYAVMNGNQSFTVEDFFQDWFGESADYGEYVVLVAPYNSVVNGDPVYCIFNYGVTALSSVKADSKAVKMIENGRVVLNRDGIRFDAAGRKF